MRAKLVLIVTAALGLACGGLPELGDVREVCPPPSVVPTVELAALDGSTTEVAPGLLLEITATGFRVDGEDAGRTAAGLQADLGDARERARERGETPSDEVLVAVDAEVDGERLVEALETLRAAEVSRVRFVLRSPDELDPPAYLDPEYAAAFTARLDSLDPSMRQAGIAAELDSLLVACPSGKDVLGAAGMASPEARCELLVAGMDEALGLCPVTSGVTVATAIQVGFQPLPYELVTLDLTLSPDGEPFEVGADASWAEIAAAWQPSSGDKALFVLAGEDEDEDDADDDAPPARSRPRPRPSPGPSPSPRPAPARGGGVEVSGGLDRDLARRALQRHRNAFKSCYDQALQRDPSAAGTVVLRMDVGSSGSVSSASLSEDGIGDAELGSCLVRAAMRVTFPSPEGGSATVSLPLVFAP